VRISNPLLVEREQLSGGAIDGPTEALSSVEVARHWDDAETEGAADDVGSSR
jgi:hypothetical protein